MINRDKFFPIVRDGLFGHELSQSQVDGIRAILDYWEQAKPSSDIRFLAYPLATAWWETGHTMQPVKERGGDAYYFRMYDMHGSRPKVAKDLGNTQPGDGVKFPGRGLPQLTGRRNYAWASKILGVDCIANPDELLKPAGAVKLMFVGMMTGHYTGRKLADYFTAQHSDPFNARRIINGIDKAENVADGYKIFMTALT